MSMTEPYSPLDNTVLHGIFDTYSQTLSKRNKTNCNIEFSQFFLPGITQVNQYSGSKIQNFAIIGQYLFDMQYFTIGACD
jgi:hypothetical protein